MPKRGAAVDRLCNSCTTSAARLSGAAPGGPTPQLQAFPTPPQPSPSHSQDHPLPAAAEVQREHGYLAVPVVPAEAAVLAPAVTPLLGFQHLWGRACVVTIATAVRSEQQGTD